jgi:hypothetical protein
MEYYTYAYLREDGTPYYIGKGKGDRINDTTGRPTKPPKDKSKRIYLKCNLTEEEAFKHEIYMIDLFGRKDIGTGILRNKSNGGEGNSGLVVSQKNKEILRQKMKENNIMKTHINNYKEGIRKRSENQEWLNKRRQSYLLTYKNGNKVEVKGLTNWARDNGYKASVLFGIIKGTNKTHKDIVAVEKVAHPLSAEALNAL